MGQKRCQNSKFMPENDQINAKTIFIISFSKFISSVSHNKENEGGKRRKMVKVDIKLEATEEKYTGQESELDSKPYIYDPIKKQIMCTPGTTFIDMKEIKDEENKNEDRMKTVDKGISKVS